MNIMLNDYYVNKGLYGLDHSDDLYSSKWKNQIEVLDLNDDSLEPFTGMNFAFLGFKSDKGVYINSGRPGAVEGPSAIRTQIAKLPWHLGSSVKVFDTGVIDGANRTLPQLQESLGQAVKRIRQLNLFPIVLGGGHETAYGHYYGLDHSIAPSDKLGIFNIDAHFDLRPYDKTGANSGTGFRQMYDLSQEEGTFFSYTVLGIQEHTNNLNLFDFVAKTPDIHFLTGQDIYQLSYQEICQKIDPIIEELDNIYLTIDLDAFNSGYAPGVSAIQSLGLDPNQILPILEHIASTGKLIGFDVVEVSPVHDVDNHTANLAAAFIFYLTQVISQSHK